MKGRCYYTLRELSKITGDSLPVLRKNIRENRLKTGKLKKKYWVTLTEFRNYLDPAKFDDFFKNQYLSEERLFSVAGVPRNEWKNSLLVQSPDWDYVLVYTQRPDTPGEIVKVGLDPLCELKRETITSDTFILLLQSNVFTSISKYN